MPALATFTLEEITASPPPTAARIGLPSLGAAVGVAELVKPALPGCLWWPPSRPPSRAGQAVALLAGRPVSYGKAAIVGVAGDLEHGGAMIHPKEARQVLRRDRRGETGPRQSGLRRDS